LDDGRGEGVTFSGEARARTVKHPVARGDVPRGSVIANIPVLLLGRVGSGLPKKKVLDERVQK